MKLKCLKKGVLKEISKLYGVAWVINVRAWMRVEITLFLEKNYPFNLLLYIIVDEDVRSIPEFSGCGMFKFIQLIDFKVQYHLTKI